MHESLNDGVNADTWGTEQEFLDTHLRSAIFKIRADPFSHSTFGFFTLVA